jgi:site-specific DNA-cytosine methylase
VTIWRKIANPRASLAEGGYETWGPADYANTLTGYDWGNALRQKTLIHQGGRLRTATILEWERLAGFPDHWTDVGGITEAKRANALGDSFPPGMAYWLGRRVMAVDAALPLLEVVA